MADSAPLKQELRAAVLAALESVMKSELAVASAQFEGLRESLEGEAKSTAGDKHETGRAMVQMEMEQAAGRLARLEEMVRNWSRLQPDRIRTEAGPGAVVSTSIGRFVVGLAWGAFEVNENEVWRAISADAPLALAMRRCGEGDVLNFRGRSVEILQVV